MQPVKSPSLEASQHLYVCPLSMALTPGVSHRSKTNLAAEVLNVLHEGVARELRAIVGGDSIWHTKMADQSLEELDS